MTRVSALLFTILIGASAAACSHGNDTAPMKELQRAKSGDLTVVLLAKNDALKPGKDEAVLEFRNAANTLVDVGAVKVNATMPMAGMAPMMGSTFVKPTDQAGRYRIDSDLTMAGTWQLAVEWSGPAGSGKVMLPGQVR
jgi:hypothetical protein